MDSPPAASDTLGVDRRRFLMAAGASSLAGCSGFGEGGLFEESIDVRITAAAATVRSDVVVETEVPESIEVASATAVFSWTETHARSLESVGDGRYRARFKPDPPANAGDTITVSVQVRDTAENTATAETTVLVVPHMEVTDTAVAFDFGREPAADLDRQAATTAYADGAARFFPSDQQDWVQDLGAAVGESDAEYPTVAGRFVSALGSLAEATAAANGATVPVRVLVDSGDGLSLATSARVLPDTDAYVAYGAPPSESSDLRLVLQDAEGTQRLDERPIERPDILNDTQPATATPTDDRTPTIAATPTDDQTPTDSSATDTRAVVVVPREPFRVANAALPKASGGQELAYAVDVRRSQHGETERLGRAMLSVLVETDWPRHQFDARNRGVDDRLTAHSDDPTVAWRRSPAGRFQGGAAVADGTVYVAGREYLEDKERAIAHVYAFGSADGRIRWQRELRGSPQERAPPTVAGDVVVVSVLDSERPIEDRVVVYALSTASGETRWTATLGGNGMGASVVEGETVYVASGDTAAAFSLADGSERWRTELPVTNGRLQGTSPAIATDRLVVSGGNKNAVFGVTLDGDVEWTTEFSVSVWSSPTVADGTVYVGDDQGTVHGLDVTDGHEQRRVETAGRILSSTVAGDGLVHVHNSEQEVVTIDSASGEVVWAEELTDGMSALDAAPAATADTLYVSYDGIYVFDRRSGDRQRVSDQLVRGPLSVTNYGIYGTAGQEVVALRFV